MQATLAKVPNLRKGMSRRLVRSQTAPYKCLQVADRTLQMPSGRRLHPTYAFGYGDGPMVVVGVGVSGGLGEVAVGVALGTVGLGVGVLVGVGVNVGGRVGV